METRQTHALHLVATQGQGGHHGRRRRTGRRDQTGGVGLFASRTELLTALLRREHEQASRSCWRSCPSGSPIRDRCSPTSRAVVLRRTEDLVGPLLRAVHAPAGLARLVLTDPETYAPERFITAIHMAVGLVTRS